MTGKVNIMYGIVVVVKMKGMISIWRLHARPLTASQKFPDT